MLRTDIILFCWNIDPYYQLLHHLKSLGLDSVLLFPVEVKHLIIKFDTRVFYWNNNKGSGSKITRRRKLQRKFLAEFIDALVIWRTLNVFTLMQRVKNYLPCWIMNPNAVLFVWINWVGFVIVKRTFFWLRNKCAY